MTTSKSPRRVLRVAYDAARQAFPAQRHRFSPKKFTQPQLAACLVLKEFLRVDYRGLTEHLADHRELTQALDLKAVPHFTNFQKAAARLLKAAPARKLMESRHVSRYYVKRWSKTGTGTQETTYSEYPKVVLVTDCER